MGRKDKKVPDEESELLPLGARMRAARQQKGVTLTAMAGQLSYTKSHLSAVENGLGRPSRELVESYERELGLEPGELTHAQISEQKALGHRHTPMSVPMRKEVLELKKPRERRSESISSEEVENLSEKHIRTHFAPVPIRRHYPQYKEDWEDAPNLEHFYGRKAELAELEQKIVQDSCSVVAILGIGGMGKSTLTAHAAKQMRDVFEYSFWRSLRNSPPLEGILKQCILFLSNNERVELPKDEDEQIEMLMKYLREYRCLIILDNFESVLAGGKRVGQYRSGYEKYGQLIDIISNTQHQSCLLLTSREKPREIALLEGIRVRSLQLVGVDSRESQKILQDKDLIGDFEAWEHLVSLYAGNPLALKLASAPIREVFGGNIAEFLKEGGIVIGDIHDLFDQQFQRLSEQEREILYWLAIEREPVLINDLREDIARPVSGVAILEALDSLLRRSMIEVSDGIRFFLQPVILEYVTDGLVERVFDEIIDGSLKLFSSHSLIKATAKDYVRHTQVRLILSPLAGRLVTTLGKDRCKEKLDSILATLRKTRPHTPEYAAGNLLNLLIQLQIDLKGYDFSSLVIWQAYLQEVNLPEVNFTSSDLTRSTFSDTFGGVFSVALSPKGDLLAAATTNNEIRLWQLPDCTPLLTCQGHTNWVRSVAFSPDGELIASGSDDQTIRLWNSSTGQNIQTLLGHSGRVYSVAFSPDGTLLASGSEDETVRLWNVGMGTCVKSLSAHTGRVYSTAFFPDGTTVVSGGEDRTIRLWEISTGTNLKILADHSSGVASVAVSPDGRTIASGSEDHTVRLWEVSTGQCIRRLLNHTDQLEEVAFSPNGRILASSSDDKTVRLWDWQSGLCLKTLSGHDNWVTSIVFTPDGTNLFSGSTDQTVRMWDIQLGYCLKTLQGVGMTRYYLAFSPDGTSIVSGSEARTVDLWEVSTGRNLRTFRGHMHWVRSVAFSPDGKTIASGSEDHTVRIWDVTTGQCLRVLRGHTIWVYTVAFSPDGNTIASGSEDQTIRLWDTQTGQCSKVLSGHASGVWSVAFSPDGNTIASGSEDQTIRLWDTQTGQCLKTFVVQDSWIPSVDFSADGKTIVSGSDDHLVRIWDVQTEQCLRILRGHTDSIYSVAFSLDGRFIASGGDDQTVRLWEVSTGQCLNVLRGHTSWIYSLAFSPDVSLIASSGGDGTIRLWSVHTGECVKILRSDRPYERMNITDVKGLTSVQKATLRVLGAIGE